MSSPATSSKRDSMSTLSAYSTDTPNALSDTLFTPVKALNIHARGIRLIRLPVPNFELTIPIYDTTGRVCYVSRRDKARSGNAVLLGVGDFYRNRDGLKRSEQWEDDGKTDDGVPLIETKYFFGPGRDPIVHILDREELIAAQGDAVEPRQSLDEKKEIAPSLRSSATTSTVVASQSTPGSSTSFKFISAWTTRTCTFTVPDTNHTFSWHHEHTVLPCGEKAKLLSLYWHVPPSDGNANSATKVKVAHLIRSASTRTPGTRPSTAGNGGRLEFGRLVRCARDSAMTAPDLVHEFGKKVDRCEEPVIDEALVVATCLSMMKKEGDRRRTMQFMMLGAIASGGS